MTVLSSKQVLQDNNTNDPNSITSLTLTHKALSDVSCLSDFKNLEKLDLTFNNLTSLEGLKSCMNLKWLSVVQNKLQSLKGVEGLTNLTVLNAGKNKLRSMDEVRSVTSLRALILNDNEIASVCRLDQMKELNTLVLSRNPICKIGEALVMTKSITKLSLSNCQLQSIDSSLKSCTELKELRLAHNELKALPSELTRNAKIQNLDLGNNLIIRWSDVKVLSSLVNLRNLNLQGNSIAEKEKSAKKIKKALPNLQIFNARPMDKVMKNEKGGRAGDSSILADKNQMVQSGDHSMENQVSKHHILTQSEMGIEDAGSVDRRKELKMKKQKRHEHTRNSASDHNEDESISKTKTKKEWQTAEENQKSAIVGESPYMEPDLQKELRPEKRKIQELSRNEDSDLKGHCAVKEPNKNSKKGKHDIHCTKISVEDHLLNAANINIVETGQNSSEKGDTGGVLISYPKKKKKIKSQTLGSTALQLLTLAPEVGLGGPSAWDE